MPRRKKKTKLQQCSEWLSARPKVIVLLVIVALGLCYLPLHAYRSYADNKKFSQTRAAMNLVYTSVVSSLGQPDNVKTTNGCIRQSHALRSQTTCTTQTEFIYGVSTRTQANVLLKQIQKVVVASKKFKADGQLSTGVTKSLVFDTYYYDALDNYTGPHHIDCSIKYSYNTPDEVDLSLTNPRKKPFEVFFGCSAKTNHNVYPTS